MAHRLLLIRHAKSSWDDPALPDRERPLNGRGRRAAERIGDHLRAEGLVPDLVLCSPAARARETLERSRLDAAEVRTEPSIYEGSVRDLLELIRAIGEDVSSAGLIGHDPAMHELASALAGDDEREPAERVRERFPTGAVAVFELDGDWRETAPDRASLVAFIRPKDLT
jgi:phosphohistidine phosphatase